MTQPMSVSEVKEYQNDITHVAIIGAGPGGLLAARYVKQELGTQLQVLRVFEQRNNVGGIWQVNYIYY
jgi:cation diffusion facilitator CzcD-associated flavoprotein CzcO